MRAATVQEETVTFSDDRQKITDVRPTDMVHVTNDNPYFTESILQWISRPFPVKEITWKSSNSAGSRIAAIPFPSSLFNLDVIWDKMSNFTFFKGGVKFAIRVNGTRFHYGKLLFMWSPQSLNTGSMFALTDNIYSASGFPHVLVSPTESETHEFIMPFAIPFSWVNLSVYSNSSSDHRYFDIGTVYVYVLNPLGVAGSATVPDVNITCYANFVEPQLAGYSQSELDTPSVSPIAAQSFVIDPLSTSLNFTTPTFRDLNFVERKKRIRNRLNSLEAQAGEIEDVNDAEGRQKSSGGLISGIAEKVASTANLFSRVPILSPIANTVSGIASGVGTVARLFGYCNPLSQEALTRMKLHTPLISHSHGLDNAVSLTLTPNARLAPGLELLGGFEEEQTLSYLCSTPSLLVVKTWTSSQSTYHRLLTIPVCPMVTCKASITGGQDVAIPTVLSFASQPFLFWRGSLRYYITVTCSAFHSGRLKISWSPDYISTSETAGSYVQVSHILDIQNETDFTFSVPWLKHTLYAPLLKYNEQSGTDNYNGFITISVVNPITAPSTPVGDVYVNVYVSACDDYQMNFVNTEKIYLPADKVKTGKGDGLFDFAPKQFSRKKEKMLMSSDDVLEAQWSTDSAISPRVCDIRLKKDCVNEIKGYYSLWRSVMDNVVIRQMVKQGVPGPTFADFVKFYTQIEMVAESYEEGLEAQFMTRETMRSMEYKPLITASAIVETGVVFGESPKSVKDVIKRSTPIKVMGKNLKMDYNPYGRLPVYKSTTPAADQIEPSFVLHYRQLYRFARGSLVLRIVNVQDFDNLSAGIQMLAAKDEDGQDFYCSSPQAVTDSSLNEEQYGNGAVIGSWNHIQPVEAAIPFYANVFAGVNNFSGTSSDQYKFCRYPMAELYILGAESDKTTSTHGVIVTECAGDDFELMFQVGPPLMGISLL